MAWNPTPGWAVKTQIGPNLVAFTYRDESVAVARQDNDDVILFSAPEKERIAILFMGGDLPPFEAQ